MQKLNLKSIYKLCKSCRPSRKEYSKICVAIFWFFVNFYGFHKLQGKHTKGLRIFLWEDPWKVLDAHSYALGLHKTPHKEVRPCKAVLGHGGRRGRWNSGDLASGLGWGVAGEGLGVAQARFGSWFGVKRRQEACTTEIGSGSREDGCSGEPAAWPGQQVSTGAPVDPREAS
jgi:hypothetical protein